MRLPDKQRGAVVSTFFLYIFIFQNKDALFLSLFALAAIFVSLFGWKKCGGDGEFIGNWVKKCIRSVGLSYVGYSHLHHLHR